MHEPHLSTWKPASTGLTPSEVLIASERSTNSVPNLSSRQRLTACSPARSCSSSQPQPRRQVSWVVQPAPR